MKKDFKNWHDKKSIINEMKKTAVFSRERNMVLLCRIEY